MRQRQYFWDQWFNRPMFTLWRGQDYTCSQSAIAQQIRNAASNRDLPVTIEDHGQCVVVKVRNANAMAI